MLFFGRIYVCANSLLQIYLQNETEWYREKPILFFLRTKKILLEHLNKKSYVEKNLKYEKFLIFIFLLIKRSYKTLFHILKRRMYD